MRKVAVMAGLALVLGLSASVYSENHKLDVQTTAHGKPITIEERIDAWGNYFKMQVALDYLVNRERQTPYVYSGNTPEGWDCSGMVTWLYKRFGLTLPHSADDLGHIGERTSNPVAGDIVVMAYDGQTDFYHTGIYLGHNKIVEANRFYHTTVVTSLDEYKGKQIRFIKVIEQLNPVSTPATMTANCWSKYTTENAAILACEER